MKKKKKTQNKLEKNRTDIGLISWQSIATVSVSWRTKPWLSLDLVSPCRLALATVCPSPVSMPSTSRETCSSTPWRAMAQTQSSTWRWAIPSDQTWNWDRRAKFIKVNTAQKWLVEFLHNTPWVNTSWTHFWLHNLHRRVVDTNPIIISMTLLSQGTVHRLHRETAGVQQDSSEEL